MSVYLLATLDTKGREAAFVRDCLVALGVDVTVVDCGCLGEPACEADVSREEVFQAAGTTLGAMQAQGDRGTAVVQAAAGTAKIVSDAFSKDKVSGVLALGGSAGTNIGTAAMRALPLGVPKLMISTLAAGDVSRYVGAKDVLMLNSVVDIAGINRISRQVLSNAAAAMAGMVHARRAGSVTSLERRGAEEKRRSVNPDRFRDPDRFRELTLPARTDDRPLICATMFGVTTPCVQHASKILEDAGYEVLVFHATGSGGRAMESLIAEGLIAGVLDITTTELADELVGGILSAGPDRLTAAAAHGVPQVVSVGATDMVNFGPRDTVPEQFAERKFHIHNPTVTLMRTTAEENKQLGEQIARKAAAATGPAAIMLPLRGVSAIDCEGQPFDDPEARKALFDAIRANGSDVELIEVDSHINDEAFAEAAARKLLKLMTASQTASGERKLPESRPISQKMSKRASTSNQGVNTPRSPKTPVCYRDCDRFWFLTWTTYGTWLPGDERGFVSPVPDDERGGGTRTIHNLPGTPYDAGMPELTEQALANLQCDPIYLSPAQADEIMDQFHETAAHRGWLLLAAAVMRNHVHLVVGVPGDPEPADLLRDFKSYASRRLNRRWEKPASDTWWTTSGSKRKLPCDDAVVAAVHYVKQQPHPLVTWIHRDFR